ncbi:MMPL family transporter [Streptomyces mirabilis]|uniref:MMPL family transporter n=1 Tax=Streptomyces mirabilis TaxID=68239 RepID=UPI00332C205E
MARRLYALGRWAALRRRRVLAVWGLLLVLVGGLGGTLHGTLSNEFSVPGVESQTAQDLLAHKFPAVAGGTSRVVFEARDGSTLRSSADRAAVRTSLKEAAAIPGVASVADPYTTGTVSPAGTIAYADVLFGQAPSDVPSSARTALQASAEPARRAGLIVEFGGSVAIAQAKSGAADVIGIPVAFLVLAVTLGSLLAAGLPLVTALVGVAIGVLGVEFVARFVQMTTTATVLALMVGLAVGIDYALFIVSRHREQLQDPDADVHESVGRATATAGSAVVFAGATVVIALAALSATGIPFLRVMGIAAAATVLVAVAAAVTLVPAILAGAGERLRPKPGSPSGPTSRLRRRGRPTVTPWGLKWARTVLRRPAAVLVVGVFALLAIALPVRDLHLGLPSNETQPTASTGHRSYDMLTRGFGPGFNATLAVVVDASHIPTAQRTAVEHEARAVVERDPDVAVATAPVSSPDGSVALFSVVPKSGPDAQATASLVHRLRDDDSAVTKAHGTMYVAGATAAAIDVSAKLSTKLPLFIGIIVALALALLTIAFRSLVIPLKAVVGFLLSIGVALGATVWVFQLGHLDGAFKVAAAAPVVCFLPVLLIGVLFGLAMDYEVFLVSRMREHFQRHGDAKEAIAQGMASSSRVVTAAALIMASVFGGFVLSEDPIVKAIGFALTVGVLVDAFVVRMTLVPAALALLGRHAWHLPRWLDRVVPDVDMEGARLAPVPAAEDSLDVKV